MGARPVLWLVGEDNRNGNGTSSDGNNDKGVAA